MKTGKLSKVEMFYIEKNFSSMSVADMAADLDRTETIIVSHLDKIADSEPVVDTKTTSQINKKKPASPVSDMMGRRFGSDGSVVAVTLTPGASERLDSARESMRSRRNNPKHIHHPLDGEQVRRRRRRPANG